jgi:hypothetical protein
LPTFTLAFFSFPAPIFVCTLNPFLFFLVLNELLLLFFAAKYDYTLLPFFFYPELLPLIYVFAIANEITFIFEAGFLSLFFAFIVLTRSPFSSLLPLKPKTAVFGVQVRLFFWPLTPL